MFDIEVDPAAQFERLGYPEYISDNDGEIDYVNPFGREMGRGLVFLTEHAGLTGKLKARGRIGLISVIRALIETGTAREGAICRKVTEIYGPGQVHLVCDILSQFDGPTPYEHLWHLTPDGEYALTNPAEFPACLA